MSSIRDSDWLKVICVCFHKLWKNSFISTFFYSICIKKCKSVSLYPKADLNYPASLREFHSPAKLRNEFGSLKRGSHIISHDQFYTLKFHMHAYTKSITMTIGLEETCRIVFFWLACMQGSALLVDILAKNQTLTSKKRVYNRVKNDQTHNFVNFVNHFNSHISQARSSFRKLEMNPKSITWRFTSNDRPKYDLFNMNFMRAKRYFYEEKEIAF